MVQTGSCSLQVLMVERLQAIELRDLVNLPTHLNLVLKLNFELEAVHSHRHYESKLFGLGQVLGY